MNKHYAFITMLMLLTSAAIGQISFVKQNSRLTSTNNHSGNCVAIADWNFDGKDDIIRLDDGQNVYIEVQRTNNTFEVIYLGTFGGGSGWAWGMTVADVDHNGYLDVAAGSYGPAVKVMLTNSTGTGASVISIPNTNFFTQNMTFADFNNDGWIDLFVCDDNAQSHIFMNDGAGLLTESYTTINFDVTGTDDSGNYGSVWTDFDNDGDLDLYIAKCRQGVQDTNDARRINVMFVNDGTNHYTEAAAQYNIDVSWQTWTASFGDLDNDGDLDLLCTNHDHNSQIFENDGTGHYTEITASTGIDLTTMTPIESTIEDFDNDGYGDLLISGSTSVLYHNNGNMTFTRLDNMFDSNSMLSFATGDLNHDGRIDLFASYGTIYNNPTNIDDAVWMNLTHNDNNFITFDLRGTTSNKGAIGGRVTIYGAWGIQVKEVRAGDNYGTTNSAQLHFGIGTTSIIDSAVVRFPGGYTTTLYNLIPNQFVRVDENLCVSPNAGISYSLDDLFICTGSTQTITADSGYSYLWSDLTSTTQTFTISAGGEYGVTMTEAGNSCPAVSRTLVIEENPDQTPVITAIGETNFCDGGTVDIVSTSWSVNSYSWSNGDTTANITASQSGYYALTIQGYCGSFTSDSILVTAYSTPLPVTNDVTLTTPGTANLSATGSTINWYSDSSSVTPLATGLNYTTPFLSASTTYWVENQETYGAATYSVGMDHVTGTNTFSSGATTNAKVYFDVFENCVLTQVKAYTDIPGTRRIELYNNLNQRLQYADVMVSPDSQYVTLNFTLTPGTDYYLTTDPTINAQIPGWMNAGPRLRRNFGGVTYPYAVNNVISITGTDYGNQYFYYFYDWRVDLPGITCVSPKVEVHVDVVTGITETSGGLISVFPNPAHDNLNIRFNRSPVQASFHLFDALGREVIEKTIADNNLTVGVDQLQPGIYQLQLTNDGHTYREKVIIR